MNNLIFPWQRRWFISVLAIWVCCLLSLGMSWAQVKVTGSVVDGNDDTPLVGARILMADEPVGAMTDDDGDFVLKSPKAPPFDLVITYFGYDTLTYNVTSTDKPLRLKLNEVAFMIGEVEIVASTAIERQRQSALTVESMSINAIKETPAANFYEGLGHLKGVDLTSASIGFKVINTRGFNSSTPVRSLQIIDGVDNQSPGLNFSLGNFLGASEMDVESVELIVGASSAFYGPNAFNGVISMVTKDPFIHKGLTVQLKGGERGLAELGLRFAKSFQNREGEDKFAFKLNAFYLSVRDWEAENMDPVEDSKVGRDNPGGYDAVNRYGDEDPSRDFYDFTRDFIINPGLGRFSRTGYEEVDLVDYDTKNLKLALAMHYKLTPKVDLIAGSNFANGTTVMQGLNRLSLKDILFFQHRVEVRQRDKFFVRAYVTHEDAGKSYDAVFTANRLQNQLKTPQVWGTDYANYWAGLSASNPFFVPNTVGVNGLKGGMRGRVMALEGFPMQSFPYDTLQGERVLAANLDSLTVWHALARNFADNYQFPYRQPGSPEFEEAFNDITSTPLIEGGTRLVDRSALIHAHGEYKFTPEWAEITTGANVRQYRPITEGNIFSDTLQTKMDSTFKTIRNSEFGIYAGIQKKVMDNRLRLNGTLRIDKNQNFSYVPTYAASAVLNLSDKDILRLSISAAIRNPTLADQFLYYNVGGFILLGNLDGYDNLADTASLTAFLESADKDPNIVQYFDVDPIQPEKVQTVELGYRTTLFEKLYIDAGYYYSRYRDFIGYNVGVEVSFHPDFPDFLTSAQPYRIAANARDIVTTQGFSIGLNYFLENGYTLAGNYSWNVLNTDSNDPIIPAFNTPEHKYNISFSGRDVTWGDLKHMGFSINYKWTQGFLFEGSPQFTGSIPSYDMLDIQVNKTFPKIKSTIKAGASNVLNNKVFQIYGGPRVGRLIYVSWTANFTDI